MGKSPASPTPILLLFLSCIVRRVLLAILTQQIAYCFTEHSLREHTLRLIVSAFIIRREAGQREGVAVAAPMNFYGPRMETERSDRESSAIADTPRVDRRLQEGEMNADHVPASWYLFKEY